MRFLSALLVLLAAAPAVRADAPFRSPGLAWAVPGEAQRRLHPALQAAGFAPEQASAPYRILAAGDELEVAKRIALVGGKILGYHPGVVHAQVTRAQLAMLAGDDALSRLEISRKLRPALDVSRLAIHADQVQDGVGLDQPYTGKGVIVGIVDTGVDVTHPALRNTDGSTRILYLWDQTIDFEDGSRRPDGFAYGIECRAEDIDALNLGDASPLDSCPSDDGRDIGGVPTEGHGTHVAGIAASSDEVYRGIAPDASLVVVRALFEEGGILDGVDYVLSKCEALQRPCVVNLSLGTTAGAHDGTALIEQVLADKTGPGRIIVASAGNEARPDDAVDFGHVAMLFGESGGFKKGFLALPDTQYAKNDDYSLLLDAWSSGAFNHEFFVAAADVQNSSLVVLNGFSGTYSTPPDDGSSLNVVLSSGSETYAYVHYATAVDPENNRRETVIAIDRCNDKPCVSGGKIDGAVADLSNRVFIVSARDTGGDRLDVWPANASGYFYGPDPVQLDFTWPGVPGSSHTLVGGDNESTVTIPATSKDIIAVGSYITKTQWMSINGTRQDMGGTRGALSTFSSRGPTSDGRVKPDVTAPGEWIASAHSSKENTLPKAWMPAEGYVHLLGTSMAAPHVTGLVALMLERDPKLAPADLLQSAGLLTQNTQTNTFTGALPNNDFGYGIIDAAAVFADKRFTKGVEIDQTPPEIKSVRVRASGSEATVSWETDEPAMSSVTLTREGGGSTKKASRLSYTRTHKLKVRGLSDGTYKVTVHAVDLAGNAASRQGSKVDAGSACGCASRSGPTPYDAAPFILLFGVVFVARRYFESTP